MMDGGELPRRRSTFRHGDLRRALIEAGVELARVGGPEAVVLREVTRRAGVVPNAAYRHFTSREDLLQSVRFAATAALAIAIEDELASIPPSRSLQKVARASLRAVGTAYLRFAQTQTGLFRTAFSIPVDVQETADPANAGRSGLNPFQLLGSALDQMVVAGILSVRERAGAEFIAWATVHGLSLLIIDGPLRGIDQASASALGDRLLDMVEKGLSS